MIVPDTSVLVAGFLPDHPFHTVAESALVKVREEGNLVAHTMAETYSVLSAPGGPYRAEPRVVVGYLNEFVEASTPAQPQPGVYREAIEVLSERGRGGASVFDALIALTARDAGATLISLNRRAKPTYELCGATVKYLDVG